MGSLKVNSVDTVTGTSSLLKTISGDQGNQWKKQEIVFSTPNHFKVKHKQICFFLRIRLKPDFLVGDILGVIFRMLTAFV